MRVILFALTISFCSAIFAQTDPEFSFQLKIRDALGYEDSITLGYDSEASLLMDPTFGEVDMSAEPFDSLIDLRACLASNPMQGHSKKQFVNWTCNSPFPYLIIGICFHAKNYPVKLSWSRQAFYQEGESCHDSTTLVNDFLYFNFPIPSFQPSIMSVDSGLIITQKEGTSNFQGSLTSGQQDIINVMFLGWVDGQTQSPTTSLEDSWASQIKCVQEGKDLAITIPKEGNMNDVQITLMDMMGREVRTVINRSSEKILLRTEGFSSGYYFLSMTNTKGEHFMRKISLR
ncbi:MAG: T9SS type A sorting domain-containing protein [Bacteroidota bacterium]